MLSGELRCCVLADYGPVTGSANAGVTGAEPSTRDARRPSVANQNMAQVRIARKTVAT